MIFAVDISNMHIAAGCVSEGKILFKERISTSLTRTELEYALDIRMLLELNRISPGEIEGSILSSVVPQLSPVLSGAIRKILKKEPLIVGPGVKTGLSIRIDNPAQLGADLVVGAVAAIAHYPLPAIIINMGTATTFSVISSAKQYLGGAILPGVMPALNSLADKTAALPQISLKNPDKLIGTNTIDCMISGIVYGTASSIDGMIDRIEEETGACASIVATGEIAHYIIPACRHSVTCDDNLMLTGLDSIYRRNIASSAGKETLHV